MTIRAFRQMVRAKDDQRKKLLLHMQDIGKEIADLEAIVGKALYKGIPGLSDAVVSTIKEHLDKSTALATTARRVEEQVRFGDSQAALDILRGFEQDEARVSATIKSKLDESIAALGLVTRKVPKKGGAK